MREPVVLIDDARPGCERLLRFDRPEAIIVARSAAEVPAALRAIDDWLARGRHVAGFASYELGYVLERRLSSLLWTSEGLPLLWFGVFEQVERTEGSQCEGALAAAVTGRAYAGPLRHEWSQRDYATRFAAIDAFISAGDIYQANLSFRSTFSFAGDPLSLYRRLRTQSRAGCGSYIEDGHRAILSLSPELFFELTRSGRIITRPMKGTAPRSGDPAADEDARNSLSVSIKDRAENLMIVDLLRNDVARVAQAGSVGVRDLFAVESYPTLHQMVSTVEAELAPGTTGSAVLRTLFPCGSVTGAPKIRAMEIIRSLESGPRGVYCGAIGYFSPDGTARFNVSIRTLTIEGGGGSLGIGSAIVHDSRPDLEYAECLLKARFFEADRRAISLVETLGYVPGPGYRRRESHLSRLTQSARALGIEFDRDQAWRALDAAAGGATFARRVRLAIDETGEIDCRATLMDGGGERNWRYAISTQPVSSSDFLSQFKTSWRDLYDEEYARLARNCGCDEVVFVNERGEIVEGSRTNVFILRNGSYLTPPLSSGALDGRLRREMLDGGTAEECLLTIADLEDGEVYFGNSLRGLIAGVPAGPARL